MPAHPPNKSSEMIGQLVHELRQSYGLGASFYRAAASRLEMTDTDMQVIDILESSGDTGAGQLASLMGLTTGTFTAILIRLEKAGLVSRERDPGDGRRVIVKLAKGGNGGQEIDPLFASLGQAWTELADTYDDEHRAFLLEFLQRSNMLAREEIGRLRGETAGNEGIFAVLPDNLESARLVFQCEGAELNLRAGKLKNELYRAQFEGAVPDIKFKDGVVTLRYPRRLWLAGKEKRVAEITLSTAIPWEIVVKGGGATMTAELDGLHLLELEVSGAGSMFRVDLPEPERTVPVRLSGSGSEFNVRRPAGTAARVRAKGLGSGVVFDNQTNNWMSSDRPMQSPDYEGADHRYDIEASGSGSMMTVSAV